MFSSCRPRKILPAANPAQQRMIIGNIDPEIRRKLPFSAKAFHNVEQLGIISITEFDNEFIFFQFETSQRCIAVNECVKKQTFIPGILSKSRLHICRNAQFFRMSTDENI